MFSSYFRFVSNSLKAAGYHIDPFEAEIGRYATFNKHEPEKPNDKRSSSFENQ